MLYTMHSRRRRRRFVQNYEETIDKDLPKFDNQFYPVNVGNFIDNYNILPVIDYRKPSQQHRINNINKQQNRTSIQPDDNDNSPPVGESPIIPEYTINHYTTIHNTSSPLLSPSSNEFSETAVVDLLDTIPPSDKDKRRWLTKVNAFVNILEASKPLDSYSLVDKVKDEEDIAVDDRQSIVGVDEPLLTSLTLPNRTNSNSIPHSIEPVNGTETLNLSSEENNRSLTVGNDYSSLEKIYIIKPKMKHFEYNSLSEKPSKLSDAEKEFILQDLFKKAPQKDSKQGVHSDSHRSQDQSSLPTSKPNLEIIRQWESENSSSCQSKHDDTSVHTKSSLSLRECKDIIEPLDRLAALTKNAIKRLEGQKSQDDSRMSTLQSFKPSVLTTNSLKSVRRHKQINLPWDHYMKLHSGKFPTTLNTSLPQDYRSETLKAQFFSPPIILPDILLDQDGNVIEANVSESDSGNRMRHPSQQFSSLEVQNHNSSQQPFHYNTWSPRYSREWETSQEDIQIKSRISTNQPPIKNQLHDLDKFRGLSRPTTNSRNKPIKAEHGLNNGLSVMDGSPPNSSYPVSDFSTLTLPSHTSSELTNTNSMPCPNSADDLNKPGLIGWRIKKDQGRLKPDEKRLYQEDDPVSELEKIYDSLDLDNENLMNRADRRATGCRINEVLVGMEERKSGRLTSSLYNLKDEPTQQPADEIEFYSLDRRRGRGVRNGDEYESLPMCNDLDNFYKSENSSTSYHPNQRTAAPRYQGGYLSQKALHGRTNFDDYSNSWLDRRRFDDDLACRTLLKESESSENDSNYHRPNFMGPERTQCPTKDDKRNWWPYVRPKVLRELSHKQTENKEQNKTTEEKRFERNPFSTNWHSISDDDSYEEYLL